MPELPEVETIKNELLPHVVGHRISGVTLFWDGMVRQPSVEEFRHRIEGQEIIGLIRRGKYLIFSLTSQYHNTTPTNHPVNPQRKSREEYPFWVLPFQDRKYNHKCIYTLPYSINEPFYVVHGGSSR